MKKRITSLLMALVLALSLVPTTVWAEDATTEVSTFEALKAAVDDEKSDIVLTADIDLTEPLLIDSATANITIRSKEGETFTLKRPDDATLYQFDLNKGGKLTLENVTLEGNGEVVQPGYPFILVEDTTCELHLKSGTTIQNCVTKNYATYDGELSVLPALCTCMRAAPLPTAPPKPAAPSSCPTPPALPPGSKNLPISPCPAAPSPAALPPASIIPLTAAVRSTPTAMSM